MTAPNTEARARALDQQKAFIHGAEWAWVRPHSEYSAHAAAKQVYPLPKVTRPRVVADPEDMGWEWQYTPERGFQSRRCSVETAGPWGQWANVGQITAARVDMLVALKANPTEEVDDTTPDAGGPA